jgi:hypothetical protein
MQDPEFLADAGRSNIIINATAGEELEEIVAGFGKMSAEVLGELKTILLSNK